VDTRTVIFVTVALPLIVTDVTSCPLIELTRRSPYVAELIFRTRANIFGVLRTVVNNSFVLTVKLEILVVLRPLKKAAAVLIFVVETKFVLKFVNKKFEEVTVWPTEISFIYVLAKVA